MSDAANTTSTDNNGDPGLNGKLKATIKILVPEQLGIVFYSLYTLLVARPSVYNVFSGGLIIKTG